ncbi:MAG: hypothetical protein H6R14_97 [Proteobacteria bacterium]|nr:hypothetical protein [Pseudomonadota bacterium]
MKTLTQRLTLAGATLALLAGCAGQAVQLGSRVSGPIPTGQSRVITAEACGFQLLLFIPIAINGRMASAYEELERQAAGDFITDVEVQERWGYRFVGTQYCTELRAKAISAR